MIPTNSMELNNYPEQLQQCSTPKAIAKDNEQTAAAKISINQRPKYKDMTA